MKQDIQSLEEQIALRANSREQDRQDIQSLVLSPKKNSLTALIDQYSAIVKYDTILLIRFISSKIGKK
jgi:hypothetical protein